jgi:hypothetical protein
MDWGTAFREADGRNEVREISELSKGDFEALGCEDVPAKKLRARVFNLEGLGSELALALRDMVDRFSPSDEGLSDAEIACSKRAKEALQLAHNVLIGRK